MNILPSGFGPFLVDFFIVEHHLLGLDKFSHNFLVEETKYLSHYVCIVYIVLHICIHMRATIPHISHESYDSTSPAIYN